MSELLRELALPETTGALHRVSVVLSVLKERLAHLKDQSQNVPSRDLPDWVRTKTEAVRTAQLQRHERDQEMQQLQQVGTIQEIIERGYA